MVTLLAWLLVVATAGAQGVVGGVVGGLPQGQPRDARVRPRTGTGSISGRVTTGDTGAPMRRALVNLNGPIPARGAYTDHEGRYQFNNLPPGSYNLFVSAGNHRSGYQSIPYGVSSSSMGAAAIGVMRSKPLELLDGQKLENIDVALPRTGVIAGRVTDAEGEPAARVQVSAWILRPGAEPSQNGFAQSDDLGQFRLFGLMPGDYLVMANPQMGGGPQAEIEGEPTGFAPTYAPGTPARAEAMRVRVTRGGQASADIRLTETRVYTISGTVVNSRGEPTRNTNVMLMRTDGSNMSSYGGGVGPTGSFTIRNVPPGQYEVIANDTPPREPGVMMTGSEPGQEHASAQVDVGTANVEGVLLTTRPGAVVTGEIVFDEPPPQGRRANIVAQLSERRQFMGSPIVEVKDTTFTMRNVFGPMVLRGSAGAGPGWALKAVLLRGKDITDEPTTFTASDSGHLQVVFTGTAPSIEGTITDEAGRPTDEAAVVLFGQDPSTWRPRSSYLRTIRIVKGQYTAGGLREGRYFAVAVPLEISISLAQPSAELFESLSKVATAVILNPGEKRTVDLTVVRMQQE